MKFGCCLNMISTQYDGIGLEFLDELCAIGFDYIELPLAEIMKLNEQEFTILQHRIDQSSVNCEVCNNFFPTTMRLTGHDVDENQILSYVGKALHKASLLGAKYVVFGSGSAKNVPDDFSLEKGYQQVVELLKKIAVIAGEKNITIVIEPLRKEECNLINTFKEGCQLAKNVHHEHVKVLVDFYHFSVEKEPIENISQEGSQFLHHVHFAQKEGRIYPVNFLEEYSPFINALKEIGYNSRISIEAYSSNFSQDASKALYFLKNHL